MFDDGFTPSPSVLQIKARMLKKAKQKREGSAGAASPPELLALTKLYDDNGGDLVKIFECLGEDPTKALKYPPPDGPAFAKKYYDGFFTYINMERVSSKIAKKRAAQITESHLVEFLMMAPPTRREEQTEELRTVRAQKEREGTDGMLTGLKQLYTDYEGDVEAIFQCLGEDPGKALKYPPSSSTDFASRYLAGEFTYVEVRKQPSKQSVADACKKTAPDSAAAGGEDPLIKALSDMYTANSGDLKVIFTVLNEDPTKALKYPPENAKVFAEKYVAGYYTYAPKSQPRKPPSNATDAAAAAAAAPKLQESPNPILDTLQRLYESNNGDLTAIFAALSEDPTKAIKYPPPNGAVFAKKYMEGAYTFYTAPEESEVSITSRMEAEDEAMSPMEVLLMLFPDVEPQLLEAAFQEANGHLEQSVELLLTAMFFSSLETCQASVEAGSEDTLPQPGEDGSWADLPPPPPGSGGLSDLQLTELNDMQGEDATDQVLALTVPPGAAPGELIRFATPAGTIVAEVPEGVVPGQPFFVKLTTVA